MDEGITLLEADEVSQKSLISPFFNYNLLGLPNSYSGIDRKSNFVWNKRGVALAYMIVPVLKSAVDLIAESLASVPMVLKDEDGNIVSRSDTSGSSTNNFLHAIEKSYSWYGVPLMQLWGTSMLLYGENYIEKIFTTFNQISNMRWLNPLAMTIDVRVKEINNEVAFTQRGKTRRIEVKKYTYSGRYQTAIFDEDEILFSREFNPIDDVRGYSKALAALGKANISMEFESFIISFYNNNGHPGVIISPKDRLVGQRGIAEWQKEWQEKFRGSQNQFKTHISSSPFDVETFDVLDVSKPLEVSQDAEDKILVSLRVPKIMVGGKQEGGHQFSKETKNAFMQTVVKPLGLSVSNSINHSGIIEEFGESGLKFGFDFSEFENVAKTDMDKQTVLQNRVQSGGISIGQYQQSIGADVVEGSQNVYMIPQGFTIVKEEDIVNPENIQQQQDNTGPDENPLNQSDRVTQSETEEQETTEFFGSKDINVEEHRQEYFPEYPKKYDTIDFTIPKKFRKGGVFEGLTIVSPDEARKTYKRLDSSNEFAPVDLWLVDLVEQMDKIDKKESLKSISANDIFKIAKENEISLSEAFDMLENFENDY
jgi:phage portal protein BeeE